MIAELRQVANVSDFARKAGLPRRTLVRLIGGQANPSMRTCEQIVEGLKKFRPAKRQLGEQQAA